MRLVGSGEDVEIREEQERSLGVARARATELSPRGRPRDLELHSAILESMKAGVCLIRRSDQVFVYTNPSFELLFGYERGELEGKPLSTILPPAGEVECQLKAIGEELETLGEATFEIKNVRKDGRVVWCGVSTRAIDHPQHGRVSVGVAQDITERKRTQKALELQQLIVHNMREGVCLVRPSDRTIVFANPKFESMLGYDEGELVDKPVTLVNYADSPEEARRVADDIAQQLRERGEATYEITNRKKDGTPLWCRATTACFEHLDFGLVWLAVHEDIKERKRAEQAIAASLHEKDVLLKEIHHRVKNNLQVVSSLLKLNAQHMTEPCAREAFESSQARVHSIALLHEKLYASRDLGSVDLAEYARGLVTTLLRAHGEAASSMVVKVEADGIRLPLDLAVPCGLMLNELLTNAFKHAFASPRSQPEVRIVARRLGEELELSVADNGVGLPPGFDAVKPRSIGVHLMHTLARQLGGTLEFTTNNGLRATLRFREHPE